MSISRSPNKEERPSEEPPAAPAAERASGNRGLLRRIVTGLLGGGGYILAVFSDQILSAFFPHWPHGLRGLPFALGVATFSLIGATEFYRAVRRQGALPSDVLGYVACILFQFFAWRRGGNQLAYLPAMLSLLLLVTLLVELVKKEHKPILNIGATLLGALYVGWLFSYLTLLHGLNAVVTPPIKGTTQGEWLVLFVTATTWIGDTGGLFTGYWLGRHKLAPTISPAKTWEGMLGSIGSAVLVAWLIGLWIHLPQPHALILGVLLGIFGLVGDLCESILKRDLGVKDFGALFPGHGGVLDRIDSLLFTAPLAYYYITFILLAHR